MTDSEKRQLRLESFKLALSIKPNDYSAQLGSSNLNAKSYNVSQLISDANKIYEELIK